MLIKNCTLSFLLFHVVVLYTCLTRFFFFFSVHLLLRPLSVFRRHFTLNIHLTHSWTDLPKAHWHFPSLSFCSFFYLFIFFKRRFRLGLKLSVSFRLIFKLQRAICIFFVVALLSLVLLQCCFCTAQLCPESPRVFIYRLLFALYAAHHRLSYSSTLPAQNWSEIKL